MASDSAQVSYQFSHSFHLNITVFNKDSIKGYLITNIAINLQKEMPQAILHDKIIIAMHMVANSPSIDINNQEQVKKALYIALNDIKCNINFLMYIYRQNP